MKLGVDWKDNMKYMDSIAFLKLKADFETYQTQRSPDNRLFVSLYVQEPRNQSPVADQRDSK